jgi:O-antigen/teichoic acid export membrane protein
MIASDPAITVYFNKHRREIGWLRLLAGYSFVQAIAQALGCLAGIVVLRALPKEDYACFMIVNTVGAVMGMLSDNGITNSLCAIGGRFWQDDEKMGSLIKTCIVLRKRLIAWSFFVITPFLVWILRSNNVSVTTIVWLVSFTLVGAYFQLNVAVFNTVMSLRQQVARMQTLVFVGILPRLALVALLGSLGLLTSPLAVAASTIAVVSQYWLLKRWIRPEISEGAAPNQGFKTEILSIVKRQSPFTVYFCLQGQIGIWLMSIFGNMNRVAELGALGRIGMIFSVLVSATSTLIVPRFARAQELCRLRFLYPRILFAFAGLVLVSTALTWLLPGSLLWLLGSQYAQTGAMLWLAVLAAGTSALAGLVYGLNVNKGWIPPAGVIIPIEILVQAILCFSVDLSSVRDVLMIGVITPIIPGLINLFVGIRRLNPVRVLNPVVKV